MMFFFKQKTAYEMRISDWSSDVCSSDLRNVTRRVKAPSTPPAVTASVTVSKRRGIALTHHKIELTAQHLHRFAAANPLDAVSELIWNGLDADATRINVTTEFDALDSMSAITVADNGSGIAFSEIAAHFQRLGDPWKGTADRKSGG